MAKLTRPKYMKVFDIQKLLKHFLLGEKRPHHVQFNPKPQNIVIIYVSDNIKASASSWSGNGIQRSTHNSREVQAELENLGYLDAYLNENIPTAVIFENILKSVDVSKASLSVITPQSLEMVGKHDILHLFSYSRFVQSKITFDSSVFESYLKPTVTSQYFLIAIDCEMMICRDGKQVGRVSMLDSTGNVIYDKFVAPASPVVDYLEKYSGLNVDNTSGGVSLKELETDLLRIIGTNTYLLGHGIENDLEALNIYTTNVIDTSYLFLNTEGHKVKLCELSRIYLGSVIQNSSHSPVEDALCCLRLLAYKISQLNNFYDPKGTVLQLNAKVETIQKLSDVPRGRGLFKCRLERLELDDLRDRKDTFHIILYDAGGKGHIAFRQSNR